MQFGSALESDKNDFYHVLPDYDQKMEGVGISHGDGTDRKRSGLNKYAIACALLASTNSILLGYDIGVMSGAILFIKQDLKISSTEVEVLVGILNLCSLVGSLLSGKTSDLIGRRYTIVLASATFLIGAILMGLAPSYGYLMAGRVIAGVGVGYALMIGPLYVAELAPAMSRGFLSSFPEIFITLGILIGYISNYLLSGLPSNINWRIMLGIAGFPAVVVAIGVIMMPESPRWLVLKGRREEAVKVLMKTSTNKDDVDFRVSEMEKALEDSSGKGVWRELIFNPSPTTRRILIAAIGVNFFMQASGNDAVVYYTPEVLKDAGIHNTKSLVGVTVVMGISKTFFVLVSALFLDRFGRRPLLLLGTAGVTVSLAALGFGSRYLASSDLKPTWAIVLCVVSVCSFLSFFSIGLGPITWVYSAEIFPLKLRAQGSSLAISVNRVVSGTIAMTFLSISHKITFAGTFFILSGVMAMGTVFFYFFIPETKGKDLEDIQALFEDKVSVAADDPSPKHLS